MDKLNVFCGCVMPVLKSGYTKIFSTVLLILSGAAIAIALFAYGGVETIYVGWGKWLFTAMYFYLVIIFLRTAVHLLLCFANAFLSKREVKLNSFPLVSIILPCYNEEKVIEKAVQSVLALTYPNYEVIIVDDGSRDDTLVAAHSLIKKAKVRVVHQKNAGKAAALNRGISESFGEFVFCMDADSVLNPDVIQLGLVKFQTHLKVAAVAGSVEIGNVKNALTAFQKLEYVSGLNLFKVAQSYLGMVTVIPGPVGLFKKSVLMEVGGYKSSTYAEDCELTLRLLMAGYNTVYVPAMTAITEAPEDIRSLVSQRYRWSRGVTQAIRENSKWLALPHKNFRNFIIMSYMLFESIIVPTANFIFAFLSIQYALSYGVNEMFGQFFLQLTLLDIILAIFCVMFEEHSIKLVAYSLVNRISYGLALEILRFFSIIDELLGLPMSWAKLVRKGLS